MRKLVKRTYYVATRILFVLVQAADETEARELGQAALNSLYGARLRRPVTTAIQTLRLASEDEIALLRRDQPSGRRRTVPASAEILMRRGGDLTTEFL